MGRVVHEGIGHEEFGILEGGGSRQSWICDLEPDPFL